MPKQKRRTTSNGEVTVAAKNANGQGSIFWKESKQRWVATYVDRSGKRREVLGRTKAAAEERRQTVIVDMLNHHAADCPHDWEGLVTWFLDEVADVRPGTMVSYRNQGNIISRDLGQVPLADLTSDRVAAFLGKLGDEFAPDTVRNVRARLGQIARAAVQRGFLSLNPVEGVRAPKNKTSRPSKMKRVLTIEEAHAVVAAARHHRLGAAVAMLFTMGNRSNEVLGLAWSDIDFEAGTATIRRGSTHAQGVGQRLDETKTTTTTGVHYLPPTVIELLRQRHAVQIVEKSEAVIWHEALYRGDPIDLVFTTDTGRLVLTQTLYAAVQQVCRDAGVDPRGVGTHTGRRTVVTVLTESGEDLYAVSQHVGHAQMSTTAGYVGHLTLRPKAVADTAARLLDPGHAS